MKMLFGFLIRNELKNYSVDRCLKFLIRQMERSVLMVVLSVAKYTVSSFENCIIFEGGLLKIRMKLIEKVVSVESYLQNENMPSHLLQHRERTARMGISLTNSKRACTLPAVSDIYAWRDHLDSQTGRVG